MEATKTAIRDWPESTLSKLTKAQRAAMEKFRQGAESSTDHFGMNRWLVPTEEKTRISGDTLRALANYGMIKIVKIPNPNHDPKKWGPPEFSRRYVYAEPGEVDEAKRKIADKLQKDAEKKSRLAAERLADHNRRWAEAIRKCVSDNAVVFFSEIELAAVFDAIASEASCGEVAELLKR